MTPSDSMERRIERLLADRYQLLELVGKGGFASVYKVRNLRLQRVEALKVLSEGLLEEPDFARRFEQEAQVAASLDHPNIVKIYDYGALEGMFWFSMQFIGGASVGRELKRVGRLEQGAAAQIAVGVLDALHYSHARGVVHRDIKPDNILLDAEGRPYLTDFGVAKSAASLVRTHVGTLLGSPAYMSPEQVQGRPLDGRSDLYSLGITLYKMVSAVLPFTGDDTFQTAMKRLTQPPPPLSAKHPDVDPALESVIMRALALDPADRFATARQMREALAAILVEMTPPRGTPAAPPPAPDQVTPTRALTGHSPSREVSRRREPPLGPVASGPVLTGAASSGAIPERARPRLRASWILSAAVLAAATGLAIWLIRESGGSGADATTPTGPPTPATIRQQLIGPTPGIDAEPSPAPRSSPEFSPIPSLPPAEPETTVLPEPEPTRPPEPTPRRKPIPTRPVARMPAVPLPTRPPRLEPTPVSPPPVAEPRRAVSFPRVVSEVALSLSSELRAVHSNESVGLMVTVAEDGTVKTAKVISEVCPECDQAALEAIRKYRFQPARDAEGKPVQATVAIAIRL